MHGDRIEFTEERIACVDRRRLLRNSENPACGAGGNFDMRGTEPGPSFGVAQKGKILQQAQGSGEGLSPSPRNSRQVLIRVAVPHHLMGRGAQGQ